MNILGYIMVCVGYEGGYPSKFEITSEFTNSLIQYPPDIMVCHSLGCYAALFTLEHMAKLQLNPPEFIYFSGAVPPDPTACSRDSWGSEEELNDVTAIKNEIKYWDASPAAIDKTPKAVLMERW